MKYSHSPVMPREIIENLKLRPEKTYVDCTLGGCGHSTLILENSDATSLLIGIDQDFEAIKNAETVLSKYLDRVSLNKGNFSSISEIFKKNNIEKADGILADLGVSSHHLDTDSRGFSFMKKGPLDMRMDKDLKHTAKDIVNEYPEKEIFLILKKYGEEKFASRIAKRIVESRNKKIIDSTLELAEIIKAAIPAKFSRTMKIHPATKTFMAIRIELNREMEVLEKFLEKAPLLLNKGGRLCILTFHSLEDRMVKHRFKDLCRECVCPPGLPICACGRKKEFKLISRKPLLPGEDEISSNPRSRSAKLRVLEKL